LKAKDIINILLVQLSRCTNFSRDKSETDVKLNGDNKMSHLDESSRLVAQSEIGFTQPLPS